MRKQRGSNRACRVRIFLVCVAPGVPSNSGKGNEADSLFYADHGQLFGIMKRVHLLGDKAVALSFAAEHVQVDSVRRSVFEVVQRMSRRHDHRHALIV